MLHTYANPRNAGDREVAAVYGGGESRQASLSFQHAYKCVASVGSLDTLSACSSVYADALFPVLWTLSHSPWERVCFDVTQ